MNIPRSLQAGDTWTWSDKVDDYPASSWVLHYVLHRSGLTSPIDITATAAGLEYAIEVDAATTAGYAPGIYSWRAYVEQGTGPSRVRHTVGDGVVEIRHDLAQASAATDSRSHARRMLDAIEAALEAAAPNAAIVSITIAGRSVQYKRTDLLILRDRYRREVASEDIARRLAAGLDSPRRILTRFGR